MNKIETNILKTEIINASITNKLNIVLGEAPTILSRAISFLLLLSVEYKIAINPIRELTITIAEIDSIIFSVIETIFHNLERAIPGMTACKGSNSYWFISLCKWNILIGDLILTIAAVISLGSRSSYSKEIS